MRYTFAVDDCWCVNANNDCYEFDDYYTGEAIERLAKYEDSMLSPEQVMLVKTIVDSTFGDTSIVERIRELLKADKEGRLIITNNRPRKLNPCTSCESGWGTATVNGYDSCFNHCNRFTQYKKALEEKRNG